MSKTASAWLEILEQILGGFYAVDNATPDWLVDEKTDRRLKVDKLYPELGMAVRFRGSLSASHSASLDEMDLMEEATRDEIRLRLCREAGIALVVIDADSNTPGRALSEIRTALSAATRRVAQQRVSQEAKSSLLPRIASAKGVCRRILADVSSPEDLFPFAQAWEDRQFGGADSSTAVNFQPGMAVRHSQYGQGLVLRVVPGQKEDDTEVVVQFSDGTMHTFSPGQARRELRASS
jgi:hypothetical protein